MSPNPTLAELRADFQRSGHRFLAMPCAGALMWSMAAVFGAILSDYAAAIALVVCCTLITPLAFLLARPLQEELVGVGNDLGRLMGRSMLMTNLMWAVAVPFWLADPTSLPLSAGVILGLQWIVLGWLIQHWIGLAHAVARTAVVLAAWSLLPEHRFVVVPVCVVMLYAASILVLIARRLPAAQVLSAARVESAALPQA